jgi:hypothetical protein
VITKDGPRKNGRDGELKELRIPRSSLVGCRHSQWEQQRHCSKACSWRSNRSLASSSKINDTRSQIDDGGREDGWLFSVVTGHRLFSVSNCELQQCQEHTIQGCAKSALRTLWPFFSHQHRVTHPQTLASYPDISTVRCTCCEKHSRSLFGGGRQTRAQRCTQHTSTSNKTAASLHGQQESRMEATCGKGNDSCNSKDEHRDGSCRHSRAQSCIPSFPSHLLTLLTPHCSHKTGVSSC